MRVKINYEAQLRIAAGISQEILDLPDGATLHNAICHAADSHGEPLTSRLLTSDRCVQLSILMFVNEQPVPPASMASCFLNEGDTILLYPPISGG